MIYINISSLLLPLNGGLPDSIIKQSTPSAQISTEESYYSYLIISGAIYKGDPSLSVRPPSLGS